MATAPDPALVAEKQKINIANSLKMRSVQVIGGISSAFLAMIGVVAQLPEEQQIALATTLLNHLGWVSLIPVAIFGIHYYARIKPQFNISPAVAAAKSVDAPQPPLAPTDNQPIGESTAAQEKQG